MAINSKIEWTDHTWNPWIGCNPISAGCDNCYMVQRRLQLKHDPYKVTRTSEATWRKPLSKGKNAMKAGESVFVCSWSDFFHPDADQWREDAWWVMQQRIDLNWLLCTKRVENICEGLPGWWDMCNYSDSISVGFTAETQACFDARLQIWISEPLYGLNEGFVSMEPLLTPIILPYDAHVLSAVIVGGETGPNARPIQADWVRSIRDQCREYNVPFFLKNWGDNAWDGDAKLTGRLLDGREHNDLPWRTKQ